MLYLFGHYFLGGSPLVVSGLDLTLEGIEQGAILDAEGLSRAIDVIGGGRLTLRRVHIVNGVAETGGGLFVHGAGSSLLMEQASVRDCVAIGGMRDIDGGGKLACSRASWPQSPPPLQRCPSLPRLLFRSLLRSMRTGGLFLTAASAVLVESTIADCATDLTGGALFATHQANVTLKGGSRVERCTANWGGAIETIASYLALLEGTVISECHAEIGCGGLHLRRVAHSLSPASCASGHPCHSRVPGLRGPGDAAQG